MTLALSFAWLWSVALLAWPLDGSTTVGRTGLCLVPFIVVAGLPRREGAQPFSLLSALAVALVPALAGLRLGGTTPATELLTLVGGLALFSALFVAGRSRRALSVAYASAWVLIVLALPALWLVVEWSGGETPPALVALARSSPTVWLLEREPGVARWLPFVVCFALVAFGGRREGAA